MNTIDTQSLATLQAAVAIVAAARGKRITHLVIMPRAATLHHISERHGDTAPEPETEMEKTRLYISVASGIAEKMFNIRDLAESINIDRQRARSAARRLVELGDPRTVAQVIEDATDEVWRILDSRRTAVLRIASELASRESLDEDDLADLNDLAASEA